MPRNKNKDLAGFEVGQQIRAFIYSLGEDVKIYITHVLRSSCYQFSKLIVFKCYSKREKRWIEAMLDDKHLTMSIESSKSYRAYKKELE